MLLFRFLLQLPLFKNLILLVQPIADERAAFFLKGEVSFSNDLAFGTAVFAVPNQQMEVLFWDDLIIKITFASTEHILKCELLQRENGERFVLCHDLLLAFSSK